ncbi:MAG: C39 family peptidase [Bacilli bacterium]
MKKSGCLKLIILGILCTIIITEILFLCFTIKKYEEENKNINSTNKLISELFQDNEELIPKMDIDNNSIEVIKKNIKKIRDENSKSKMIKKLNQVITFMEIKNELWNFFNDDVLILSVDNLKIENLKNKINELPIEEQNLLNDKLLLATNQLNNINTSKQLLRNLFQDDNLTIIKDDVTREEKNKALDEMKKLPQKKILSNYQQYFDQVEKKIADKEAEEEKKRQEELARQQKLSRQIAIAKAKEESIKKEQEEKIIQEAYVEISGISMINQKDNKVFNGCEVAALLMALKYKGYATSYNLLSFAEEMPKHDSDPHQGFVYSIFDLAPTDVTHWIAPDALAAYGSKFTTTTNVSGITGDQIKQYIDKNTPVIVYATYGFREPTKWIGEVPLNLHVMLVTGYNKITGAYVINDPWANKIIVKRESFERIYNLMHFAVIVN